ncbi:MAG TPA: SDR family oxidoreductase [Chlamydiales bacterium]|nr:SDR family oxidoreductase [Chlamydiales bacterium]
MRLLSFLLLFSFLQAEPVVLITGASRGIGLAIVERLAQRDYKVYAGIRPTSSSKGLSQLQEKYPNRIALLTLDVTDEESVQSAVSLLLAREGKIDALVNNAGIMAYGSLENLTIDEAKAIFEVNLFGVMRVCQAVLPAMRAQNSGRIVQISSRAGFRPLPSLSLYASSKFALEGLSETMAATLTPWNIHISLIEPGPVDTELDALSPYGTRLQEDPYRPLFDRAGLLDPVSPFVQSADEIAAFVQTALEEPHPLFRYQTTPRIESQAKRRLVDITGLDSLTEWNEVLFPHPNQ